ncbi:MAG: AmmeMemoRadiSam system protein A [Candidatus Competibacteraceae bacterium]|jgi:AmmeMemoRadiSam system protein A|nr:AmmeMemoRadiSam system protein A [Candidatus Competibacteraceae bacterium]
MSFAASEVLSAEDQAVLLEVARQSITSGLEHGCALSIDPNAYPASLQPIRATFVTLEIDNNLRGCIGALDARLPLVEDVAEHAYSAAFEDPRFPPLRKPEFAELALHISVLSPPLPLSFESEDDVLAQLRPGVDGLVLQIGANRATFLPSVWEHLPDPYIFLAQLKQKAGLPLDYWSADLRIERYTTESFGNGPNAE